MASDTCNNPSRDKHSIAAGDRLLQVSFRINWGDTDIRDEWQGSYAFCSFGCMQEWAAARAVEHDDSVLREGPS